MYSTSRLPYLRPGRPPSMVLVGFGYKLRYTIVSRFFGLTPNNGKRHLDCSSSQERRLLEYQVLIVYGY